MPGQLNFAFLFPDQLRAYLTLTADQVSKIDAQNNAFERWSAERSRRVIQVQMEIGIETARSPLDPAALGVRYAEVEAIRREIAEREKAVLAENVAVLTAAQVTKLKALEEAMKLVSTGNAAQSVRLLPCPENEFARLLLGSATPVIRDPLAGLFPGAACGQVSPIGFSMIPFAAGSAK
ncbi:MAG: hypothetical protein JNM66_21820 [Bryobacterales bacterium]|nr:hypothetical protein [Bryobacterales bacterium]